MVVSTEGNGEHFGESSLPFAQLASRLYIFHFDPQDHGDPAVVSDEAVASVRAMAIESWARERVPAELTTDSAATNGSIRAV